VTVCELTRLVAVRLLDTTGRRGGLAGCLGGELLTGSLATSGLTCEVCQYVVAMVIKRHDKVLERKCWTRLLCGGAKPGRDERARPDCDSGDKDGGGDDDGDGDNLRAVCLVRAIAEMCVDVGVGVDVEGRCW
jgi:hypothetical protein